MKTLTQEQYNLLKERGLDQQEILTLASSKGYSLPTSNNQRGIIPSLGIGAVKGLVGDIARPTAQMLQGFGQRALAGITPGMDVEDVKSRTGLQSLKDETQEGRAVVESLRTKGGAETVGRVAANVASFFIPISPSVSAVGRGISTSGRVVSRAGIGLSSKEAPLMQAYKARNTVGERILAALKGKDIGRPITNAETAIKQGIFGTESMIGVQSKRAADNIWKGVIAPALKGAKGTIHMPSFINEMRQQIRLVPELTRRKSLEKALNAFSDDYQNVGKISYEKLQQLKEGWARFLPDKAFKGEPIAQSFKEIQNIASSLARNKIYTALKDVEAKVAYFDYGNLKNLQELGQKAMTGQKLKGGAGGFISGVYDKVVTPVATTGGLTLYRVGEGLQFVGRQGEKILGKLFR